MRWGWGRTEGFTQRLKAEEGRTVINLEEGIPRAKAFGIMVQSGGCGGMFITTKDIRKNLVETYCPRS